MKFPDTLLSGSYALFAVMSKMCSRFAKIVVYAWTKKQQYHCDSCGICRGGGRDNFFHCDRCGCCYSNALQNGHRCVEKSMHQNCPVCFEVLLLFISCLRKFSFVVSSNISEPKQHLWMMADFHA
jgi:hypothetical protein